MFSSYSIICLLFCSPSSQCTNKMLWWTKFRLILLHQRQKIFAEEVVKIRNCFCGQTNPKWNRHFACLNYTSQLNCRKIDFSTQLIRIYILINILTNWRTKKVCARVSGSKFPQSSFNSLREWVLLSWRLLRRNQHRDAIASNSGRINSFVLQKPNIAWHF